MLPDPQIGRNQATELQEYAEVALYSWEVVAFKPLSRKRSRTQRNVRVREGT